jgi:hypothetical protein
MSLESFQRALCDLIASPRLCHAVRAAPDSALASYELTARERQRLMNCTLYRSNRITPIFTLLNYTCLSLGDEFGPLMDQFWDAQEFRDGQFQSEIERFAIFLRRRIADRTIASPFAGELLEFELAIAELEFGPRKEVLRELAGLPPPQAETPCRLHPLARIVRFKHDPTALLGAAATGVFPPDIATSDALLVLSVRDSELRIFQLSDTTCCNFDDLSPPGVGPLIPRLVPELRDAGLLVPSGRADDSENTACETGGAGKPSSFGENVM